MNHLEAIALNNLAVERLQTGSVFKAYEMMYHAHQCLNDEPPPQQGCNCRRQDDADRCLASITRSKNRRNEGSKRSRECCSFQWVDFTSRTTEQNKSLHHTLSTSSKSNASCLPFLCMYAVQISIPVFPQEESSLHRHYYEEQQDCDCAIRWAVLYNFALTNHLVGISLGEPGHFLLEQAHHFYSSSQLTVPTATANPDIFRMLLGTQNNQMSIYMEFGMHKESRACLKILTDLMLALPQFAERLDFDHEILLNLMVWSRTETPGAA